METQIGKYIHWGAAVSVDTARRLLRILPDRDTETMVEFDSEAAPDIDDFETRVSSL